ncbi:MAG: DUF5110 domain-containing protein, partial [Spirochaetales bacterium]|nr:DUF5110 domain-containing protein [Spirochaetales bacterium]
VSNQQVNAREMLDDCQKLREHGMPCDTIGLEPGWMENYYDASTTKEWHHERFYIPPWVRGKESPQTFAAAAGRLGFKLSLWLCCEYDLTWEEERRAQRRAPSLGGEGEAAGDSRIETPASMARHEDDFEQDDHFGHNPRRLDSTTIPEEPWFKHLEKFVDDGARAFKMDGAYQVNEHPDRMYGNGLGDDANHNLYPIILNKQMDRGYVEYTGKRSLIYSSGGYAGIQRYAATWAGDTGGGPKPLTSMLNHGLSGHVNTSCDMEIFSPEGIHFGFLQPWSQICSWAYWRHPWLLDTEMRKIFLRYNRFHYAILPYIYSMAHKAYQSGMPIMRAMELVFPDDMNCRELLTQYMFGDAFLVSVFSSKVYLPEGEWIDYWSRRRYEGGRELDYVVPSGRGGGLFVRPGTIIPRRTRRDFIGQRIQDSINLQIFPGAEISFVLCEDDGITELYKQGEIARTLIKLKTVDGGVQITIGDREGSFNRMPARRRYSLSIYADAAPADIRLTRAETTMDLAWRYNEKRKQIRVILGDIGPGETVIMVK